MSFLYIGCRIFCNFIFCRPAAFDFELYSYVPLDSTIESNYTFESREPLAQGLLDLMGWSRFWDDLVNGRFKITASDSIQTWLSVGQLNRMIAKAKMGQLFSGGTMCIMGMGWMLLSGWFIWWDYCFQWKLEGIITSDGKTETSWIIRPYESDAKKLFDSTFDGLKRSYSCTLILRLKYWLWIIISKFSFYFCENFYFFRFVDGTFIEFYRIIC